MRELVPNNDLVGVLVNPNFPGAKAQLRDAQAAARERGVRIEVLNASSEHDFDRILATLGRQRAGTLLVSPTRCS